MINLFFKKKLLFLACFLISFSLVLLEFFSGVSASDNGRDSWYLWSCSNQTTRNGRPVWEYFGRVGTNPYNLHVSINNSNTTATHVTFVTRNNSKISFLSL